MSYQKVKSQYIKSLILGASWENEEQREYIDFLIELERVILEGVHGMAEGIWYHHNTIKYRKEWEILYRELKPEIFERIIESEKREAEEQKKRDEEWMREWEEKEKRQKEEWLEMGGRE